MGLGRSRSEGEPGFARSTTPSERAVRRNGLLFRSVGHPKAHGWRGCREKRRRRPPLVGDERLRSCGLDQRRGYSAASWPSSWSTALAARSFAFQRFLAGQHPRGNRDDWGCVRRRPSGHEQIRISCQGGPFVVRIMKQPGGITTRRHHNQEYMLTPSI